MARAGSAYAARMARDEKAGAGRSGSGRPGSTRIGTGGAAATAPKRRGLRRGSGKGRPGKGGPGRAAVRRERISQVRQAFTITRKADPRLVPMLAIAFFVPFVLLLLLGIFLSHPVLYGLLGFLIGLIALVAVFGRRAQRNAYSQVEGQIGAAAAVIQNMRGDWRVTPAVGFTREQDLVHRVLGRPGIILVAEGSPARTRSLIVNEKKKLARFVGDIPVYDLLVGDGEGRVPLRGLERHFVKLPRNVKPRDVNILDRKLKAMAPALPVPKGPMPGGGRMPRGKVR